MRETLPKSVHVIRGSAVTLILQVFFVSFFIETVYALLLIFLMYSQIGAEYYNLTLGSLWFLHTLKFIIEISAILRLVAGWASTNYYLRDHFLVRMHGIWESDEDIFDLRNLRGIEVEEGWLGKLINVGTVKLTIASSSFHEEVYLRSIPNARRYERWIRDYLGAAITPVTPPTRSKRG